MIDYGLKDKVAVITGANNPQGIGAATAFAFVCEGAKVVLVYKKEPRPFDPNKTARNGTDRYFAANAGNADVAERKLKEMDADYLVFESDITDEDAVKAIYSATRYCGNYLVPGKRAGKNAYGTSYKGVRWTRSLISFPQLCIFCNRFEHERRFLKN